MRRLQQTLADYIVIAISPALIMLLVGSLLFFLLRVFYQGEFQERLHWVMACFVFAAVLIGRISIEQGFERAAPFGAALTILVGIAANRFMEYHGTWIDHFGWIINFTLIGVVWWCAHRLTWDCTVIDESQDASGEGLMQIAGLERPADERNRTADDERRLEGTTSRHVPASYWQRYVEHQRRPHAPGVWVVYFSLAALPIFGVGQLLIPAADAAGRRYVFWLLLVYVASGLGLLLTTSFLGLRRYLRQRRIEMPTLMANLWLATGTAIVAALLVAAALLPRPSAEYAIAELPFEIGSPGQDASTIAPLRRDGTQDEQPAPAAEQQPADARSPDEPKPGGEGNEPQGQAEGENAATTKSSESPTAAKGEQGDSSTDKGKQSGAKSNDSSSEPAKQDPAKQQGDSPSNDDDTSNRFAEDAKRLKEKLEESAKSDAEKSASESPESEPESTDEPMSTPEIIAPVLGPVTMLIKVATYVIFGLGALAALIRYRHEVLSAIRNFLAELRAWWRGLFGGKRDHGLAADETATIKIPHAPFSSFADPFASRVAGRYSAEELVRYSFEAFEAWSREHGCPREPDQTPHEMAREVGRLNAFIAADARNIAELYARAAYGRGSLPATCTAQLRELWGKMTSTSGVRTFTADELTSWS
jgi:hypothetical protein